MSAPREEVKDWSFEEISRGMNEILPCLFTWHAPHLDKSKVNPCEDSYTASERQLVENLVQKRTRQVQSGLSVSYTKEKDNQK